MTSTTPAFPRQNHGSHRTLLALILSGGLVVGLSLPARAQVAPQAIPAAATATTSPVAAPTLTPAAMVRARDMVQVSDGHVRLGDLFDALSPQQAAIVIGDAPAAGRRLTFDALALSRLAQTYRVAWQTDPGARVVVERPAVEITTDRIQTALAAAAVKAGAPEGTAVQLDDASLSVEVPASDDTSIGFNNVLYDAEHNRVVAEMVISSQGVPVLRQTVGARATAMVNVPVLTRRVMPGEVIARDDITWIHMARDRFTGDVVLDATGLVGRTVRHAFAANQPLRATDVRAPVVVSRGSLVTLMLQTPAMTLTVQGRAMADGGVGDAITVINTNSNRQIEGTVAGPNLVAVQLGGLASNLPGSPVAGLRTAMN